METKTSKNVSPSERRLQKQNKRLMKETKSSENGLISCSAESNV